MLKVAFQIWSVECVHAVLSLCAEGDTVFPQSQVPTLSTMFCEESESYGVART